MATLTGFFNNYFLQQKSNNHCVTIIGSGGKTSLVWKLASAQRAKKTLVSTTTRMFMPEAAQGMFDKLLDGDILNEISAEEIGIYFAGRLLNGKFYAPVQKILAAYIRQFEYVFIEGDGARMLPLKAWADYEPVIPNETTLTVGVVPLWTIGLPAEESLIHRMKEWTKLSGCKENEIILAEHIASVIQNKHGLFKNAVGKKLLFFNQIDNESLLKNVYAVKYFLNKSFTDGLVSIISGSVKNDVLFLT